MELTLENCVEFVRSSTPEAVKEAVLEMNRAEEARKSALGQKCAAYFASKDERLKRIVDQLENISEQRQAVEAEKARHNQALVNATLARDAGTVAAIQGKLSGCESDLASFTAQIEMFRAYELRGDPALFQEIAQDHAALLELIEANKAIRTAMDEAAQEIAYAWKTAVVFNSGNWREPWQDQIDRVQKDQRKTPETVGAKLEKKARVVAIS